MWLVIAKLPPSPDAEATAARLTGQPLAEVRARLGGTLPRVLSVEADGERARALAAALEGEGFTAIACDPRMAPADDDRLVARTLSWDGSGHLLLSDGSGETDDEEMTATSLALVQRGLRTTTTTEITKKKERHLSVGRALLSGGLILTKTVRAESARTTTERDPFLLLHRGDGQRDVILYARRLDYAFLGAAMHPTSAANFETVLDRLRAWAPAVTVDRRAANPAFMNGLPVSAEARVDVALWLVWLAHLRRPA